MPSGKIDIEFGHKPYDLLASPAHFQHFPIPAGINSSIPFPLITTTSLPQGTVGVIYSTQLAAIGGSGGYTWTMSPANVVGLTISSGGLLSGTPSATSATTPTFTVTDSLTRSNSANLILNIQAASGSSLQFPQMGAYLIGGTINFPALANIALLSVVVNSNYEGYNTGPGSLNANIAGVRALAPKVAWVNPANMVFCGIRNLMELANGGGSGYTTEWAGDLAENWFLWNPYSTRGTYSGSWSGQAPVVSTDGASVNAVNLTSPHNCTNAYSYGGPSGTVPIGSTYRQWNAALSTSTTWPFATNMNGMYFDNFFPGGNLNVISTGDWTETGESKGGSDATTAQNWRTAFADAVAKFKAAMDTADSSKSHMMFGNLADWVAGTNISGYVGILNGGVMEGCVGASYAWEKTSWTYLMNNYANCMNNTTAHNGAGPYVIWQQQSANTNWAGMRYGICSCLLDNGYWSNQPGGAYNQVTLTDEMTFGLGSPIAGPNNASNGTYSSGGLTVWSQGVWRRDFQNGVVLVNPRGNGAQTVVVDSVHNLWHLRQSVGTDGVNSAAEVVAGGTVTLPDPATVGTGGSGLILSRTAT